MLCCQKACVAILFPVVSLYSNHMINVCRPFTQLALNEILKRAMLTASDLEKKTVFQSTNLRRHDYF